MKRLILASASPRRKELLSGGGFEFAIITSDKESRPEKGLSPAKYAVKCAVEKCEDVYLRAAKGTGAVVLGADTVVALDGEIFGKPTSEADAERMLKLFSGKTHTVITGYALITDGMRETGEVESEVTFNELTDEVISAYLKSGLYKGKAGAYGIQDGFDLVKECKGYRDNVIGLPIEALSDTIKEFLK